MEKDLSFIKIDLYILKRNLRKIPLAALPVLQLHDRAFIICSSGLRFSALKNPGQNRIM